MIYAQLHTIDIDIDSTILRTVMHPQVVARFLLIRAPLTIMDPQINIRKYRMCEFKFLLFLEFSREDKCLGCAAMDQ